MSKRSRKAKSATSDAPVDSGSGSTAVMEPRRPSRRRGQAPTQAKTDWIRILVSAAVVLIVVGAIYGRTVGFQFVSWDDDVHVYQNPHLVTGDAPDVDYFWRHAYRNLYIPATYTLWSMVAESSAVAFKPGAPAFDPSAFHLTSVILHAINSLLVLAILRLLLRRGRFAERIPESAVTAAALIGALVFAAHPLQVESVDWISETKGLLCAAFSLAALYCYFQYASIPGAKPERRPSDASANLVPWGWITAASTAFVFALLSKPSAVSLPLIALAVDYWWLDRPIRRSAPLAGWLFVSLLFVLDTRSVQPVTSADTLIPPVWQRLVVAGDALAFYLGKLILPIHLNFDYGRTPDVVLSHRWVYATCAVPVALALIASRGPAAAKSAYAAFVAALLPVLGLVPFIYQVYSTVADRYAYLSMFGIALLLAWLAACRPGPAVWAACGIVIVIWGGLAYFDTGVWRDSATLYRHGIAENPKSWGAYGNLAMAESDAGQFDAAEADYRKCIALEDARPGYLRPHAEALNGLGTILSIDRHRPADALPYYDRALAIQPGYPEAHLNKGIALDILGRRDEAIAEVEQAIRNRPTFSDAEYVLGGMLENRGDMTGAIEHLKRAVDLQPDNPDYQTQLNRAESASTGASVH